MELYERRSTKHYTKSQFLKWGLVQFLVLVVTVLLYKVWKTDWLLLIPGFLCCIVWIEAIILTDCFFQGYQIMEDGILYYHMFQKNDKRYFMLYSWLSFAAELHKRF